MWRLCSRLPCRARYDFDGFSPWELCLNFSVGWREDRFEPVGESASGYVRDQGKDAHKQEVKGIDLHFNDCTHQGGHGPDGRGARWAAQVLGQSERSQGGEPKALTTGDSKGESQVIILFQLTTSCIPIQLFRHIFTVPETVAKTEVWIEEGKLLQVLATPEIFIL